MRKTFRFEDNKAYWDRRWSAPFSDARSFDDLGIYPIKYAEMAMNKGGERALELGCGPGRILKHYHNKGRYIVGIERSEAAVRKIRADREGMKALVADAKALPFYDEAFDVILAFGLYHNIEYGFMAAVKEALRCLKRGGRFCISMKPDNMETRLGEWLWDMEHKPAGGAKRHFHKWIVTEQEFSSLLEDAGCAVEEVRYAKNVSVLWRIPFLRNGGQTEAERRSSGYKLNIVGFFIDSMLSRLFPPHFCNVLVFMGHKR